ncbi:hypothetical protein [Azospirillum brasilense]|uniref:hypothetical protein n=1 Tax=Azospirillum brasilense TaxID=192 RepID=UPI0011EFC0EC|nr:hypothetical protein [Azospirillum brasilense]
MKVIESFLMGRMGYDYLCEDSIFINDNYVAVIDGATQKSGVKIDGVTPGRSISETILSFLKTAPSKLSGEDLIREVGDYVQKRLLIPNGINKTDEHSPSASIAIVTIDTLKITIVGDVQSMINGSKSVRIKKFDEFMGEARSLYIKMLIADGRFENNGLDIGRETIMPWLGMQHVLRNNPNFGEWSYGAIDGHKVDKMHIEEISINIGDEIVLCTDGYPTINASLALAESELMHYLEKDPLRIYDVPSTKGLEKGNISFDDRAYIRIII